MTWDIDVLPTWNPGRSDTADTREMVARVEHVLRGNRRITLDEVVSELNISHGSAHHIIHNVLEFCKVSARWVPRQLAPKLKTPLLNFLSQSFTCCNDNHASPYCIFILRWISVGFTSSLPKKRMTERCSSLVHASKGAAFLELLYRRHTLNVARSKTGKTWLLPLYIIYIQKNNKNTKLESLGWISVHPL